MDTLGDYTGDRPLLDAVAEPLNRAPVLENIKEHWTRGVIKRVVVMSPKFSCER